MFGPNNIGSMPIPTLLRQGGISTGPAPETQNYSVNLDGVSDMLRSKRQDHTWMKVMVANRAFSLHFSIKLTTVTTVIYWCGNSSDYVWMHVTSAGKLTLQYAITGASASSGVRTFNTNFAVDTWYDVVITASNDSLRDFTCYVNGSAVTTQTVTSWPVTAEPAAIAGVAMIGTFFGVTDYNFKIDRIASWDGELTEDEVTEIYDNYPDLTADSGDYVSSAKLKTYYPIEEGSGTRLINQVDSGLAFRDFDVINATANFWDTDTRI